MGVPVKVQSSTIRCFTDEEYARVGAEIVESVEELGDCNLIVGVKEVKIEHLLPDRNYMFFAHVIKAQDYNMPLLDTLLERNIRHIDYEKIENE